MNNNLCKNNDHDFGEWKEEKVTTIENVGFGYLPVKYTKFTRECKNCGAVQYSSIEPITEEAIEDNGLLKRLLRKRDNTRNN